ncbi:MAG: right-handed parallel beta-helix repeat-containing protein [Kiritimatiellia bacterium]
MSGRSGARWGGISFENTTTPSSLRRRPARGHEGIRRNRVSLGHLRAGRALVLDFVDPRECGSPVFCSGGSATLRDSILQNPYTGDGINVKQGQAVTQRCVFYGNNQPDTDAIDYDGVVNGLIEDCRLYRYQGFNSDSIDIGEACSDILIQRNQITYNSDKGVSVGQGSTVTLRHNLVVGCALGVGIKDSGSTVLIDQNTFYECDVGVAVYEKNFGDGGGAATVRPLHHLQEFALPGLGGRPVHLHGRLVALRHPADDRHQQPVRRSPLRRPRPAELPVPARLPRHRHRRSRPRPRPRPDPGRPRRGLDPPGLRLSLHHRRNRRHQRDPRQLRDRGRLDRAVQPDPVLRRHRRDGS